MASPLLEDDPGAATAASPLAQTILTWTMEHLRQQGYPRPAIKRIAFLITGLVLADSASRGDLATTLEGLQLSSAKAESIATRLGRLLDDSDLDPQRLLPDLYRDLVPTLLAGVVAAHRANQNLAPFHHRRFPPVRVIVDASTKGHDLLILVAGLAYQGVVIPLALRTWKQDVPLGAGDYWLSLSGVLRDVQSLLPPELRDHVLVCADRFFGVPRMLDLLSVLGWSYLLRIQGQTRIRRADGTELVAKDLAPRKGVLWCSDPTPTDLALEDEAIPVAAFKEAGWRFGRVVAAWAEEADEPWLLLTSLSATPERLHEYARRWAIERLFLTWKSHGWQIETLRITDPRRLGRLLSGLVIATFWTLAAALPKTLRLEADLRQRANLRPILIEQLRLPLDPPKPPTRPWPAKLSLLTWGRAVFAQTAARFQTPALRWDFPDWDALPWAAHCSELYHVPA